jgi:hypothetical protein
MNKQDSQELTLWLGATRYYLGRRTYAVNEFCDLLRAQWSSLNSETQRLLARDIEAAFDEDDRARIEGRDYKTLGDDCDRESWTLVRSLWTRDQISK